MRIEKIWDNWINSDMFSGVFYASTEDGVLFEKSQGLRNKGEKLSNNIDTAFAIASGTKLFTGLAVCKLIDKSKLTLDDKLWNILPYDLGEIDKQVTVHHLLTHTSGIGDYIDEEADDGMECYLQLCRRYPVYLWERLEYYLQMITPIKPKFKSGTRFGYSNAGFIMLGLVVEAVSGVPYQQFVTDEIISPLELGHTGFYRMDMLPANTALGYTGNIESGMVRTNIFDMPIIGGSDGGLFTCAKDLDILWRAVFAGKVLSANMLDMFLKLHAERGKGKSYGLGVYRYESNGDKVYYAVGGDFGVDFFTAYFPKQKLTASALGNTEINTYPLLEAMFAELLK